MSNDDTAESRSRYPEPGKGAAGVIFVGEGNGSITPGRAIHGSGVGGVGR